MQASGRPRIALFTHDTFGLGHVRRCMHILRELSASSSEAALLLITGSPVLHALETLPPHADVVKIPTVARTGPPESRPPHLPLDLPRVTALRQALVEAALTRFEPDVLLVDNFPLGSRKELRPVLEMLRGRPTRTVLGLRDIVDMPETVRAQWKRDGIPEVLERCYDRILVYGEPEVLDVCQAYDLPIAVARKVHYCGYVTGRSGSPRERSRILAELGLAPPLVVGTVGGGGDGVPLGRALIDALADLPDVSALVVTGPLMSEAHRSELRARAARCPRLVLREFVRDLPSVLAAADLVVSMGGYNTVAEILAVEAPAILVPRTWRYGEHARGTEAGVEGEQLLRARALEKAGRVGVVEPEDLGPRVLRARIRAALAQPRAAQRVPLDLDGLGRAVEHLLELAQVEGGRR